MPDIPTSSLFMEHVVKSELWLEENEQFIESVWYRNEQLIRANQELHVFSDNREINNQESKYYPKLSSLLLSDEERTKLFEQAKCHKINHDYLKKWGQIVKPNEAYTFKPSSKNIIKPSR